MSVSICLSHLCLYIKAYLIEEPFTLNGDGKAPRRRSKLATMYREGGREIATVFEILRAVNSRSRSPGEQQTTK